uniref:glutaminase n=1 Tax=Minutocellus polymorphus TaxID=265543 RepID=A0A7S0AIC6_9STRA
MDAAEITIGVLALQGAFEEHQERLERLDGVKTVQVRTPADLASIDGIVLPGGESTAMGLIGSHDGTWDALKRFINGSGDGTSCGGDQKGKPTWGTCAGMVLLSDRCVGTSAVIEDGQALIGGLDVLVCRNYFGSQISSFELSTPCPPLEGRASSKEVGALSENRDYPGIFIRAPAILNAGPDVEVLGRVLATPCRQAAVVLRELERKIGAGEEVIKMGVVDALVRDSEGSCNEGEGKKMYIDVGADESALADDDDGIQEEKKDANVFTKNSLHLPGAASCGGREVICAVRKNNIISTCFHPELTADLRWHEYFVGVVRESKLKDINV